MSVYFHAPAAAGSLTRALKQQHAAHVHGEEHQTFLLPGTCPDAQATGATVGRQTRPGSCRPWLQLLYCACEQLTFLAALFSLQFSDPHSLTCVLR
jgi:hypothetical protein